MSIERFFNPAARGGDQYLAGRYRQPGALTEAGVFDRRQESKHVARIRDFERQAVEYSVEQQKRESDMCAYLSAKGRAVSEAKYLVLRNHKESQFLADADPVLQAQFGVLD